MCFKFGTLVLVLGVLQVLRHSMTSEVICPEDSLSALFACLANVTSARSPGVRAVEDVQATIRKCQHGDYSAAVTCVKTLFKDCSQDFNRLSFLKMMVSPHDLQQSFYMLCSSIPLLSKNSDCLQSQDFLIQDCVSVEERAFNSQTELTDPTQHVMVSFCNLQFGIRRCTLQPIYRACGTDFGDLLLSLMTGVIPPICKSALFSDSVPGRCVVNWSTFLACLMLTVKAVF